MIVDDDLSSSQV